MTDYGHAMALMERFKERAKRHEAAGRTENAELCRKAAAEEAHKIATADWRCRKCGVVTETAKQSACEHSFTWDYTMVNPGHPGSPAPGETR